MIPVSPSDVVFAAWISLLEECARVFADVRLREARLGGNRDTALSMQFDGPP